MRVIPPTPCTLRDDELAQLVDVLGLRAHDHVVGPGDVLGGDHPRMPAISAATAAALPTSVWTRM